MRIKIKSSKRNIKTLQKQSISQTNKMAFIAAAAAYPAYAAAYPAFGFAAAAPFAYAAAAPAFGFATAAIAAPAILF